MVLVEVLGELAAEEGADAGAEAEGRGGATRPVGLREATRSECTEPACAWSLKEAPHAPRGYIYASMMLLAGQVAAVPFVASIPSM